MKPFSCFLDSKIIEAHFKSDHLIKIKTVQQMDQLILRGNKILTHGWVQTETEQSCSRRYYWNVTSWKTTEQGDGRDPTPSLEMKTPVHYSECTTEEW